MFYELLTIHGAGTESILHIYIAFIWGKTQNNIKTQSNLSYVTFQGNSEIWLHKTGGRLIQV